MKKSMSLVYQFQGGNELQVKLGLCHPFHGCGAQFLVTRVWHADPHMQYKSTYLIIQFVGRQFPALGKLGANQFLSELLCSIQLLEKKTVLSSELPSAVASPSILGQYSQLEAGSEAYMYIRKMQQSFCFTFHFSVSIR